MVDVIRYTDKFGNDRRVYLRQHGRFIGESKTPEELGKVVDRLAGLVRHGVENRGDG